MADEAPPPLNLSLSPKDNPESAGEEIRAWLGTPARKDDLNQWIELVEAKTILVTQVGGVDLSEMRGCSISDQPFPVVVLNGADSPRGRVFTLMHELAHILLHSGGLCDREEPQLRAGSAREQTERFCNHVAAAALMPRAQMLGDPTVARSSAATRWTDEDLKHLADVYGVSREAVLLRLVELGRTSWEYYFDRRPHPWVIAFAKLHDHTVVTEEAKLAKKPRIPSVCDHYGVKHITFLELIRLEEWTF